MRTILAKVYHAMMAVSDAAVLLLARLLVYGFVVYYLLVAFHVVPALHFGHG